METKQKDTLKDVLLVAGGAFGFWVLTKLGIITAIGSVIKSIFA